MNLRDTPAAGRDPGALERTAEQDGAPDDRLLCAGCEHAVARVADALVVGGRHEYTFTNPQGYVYTVRLFVRAGGCRDAGEPTLEATWFPGHAWRHAVCGGCGEHLGWRWQAADGAGFHGLIRQRVREAG